jgi:hypothetical protein
VWPCRGAYDITPRIAAESPSGRVGKERPSLGLDKGTIAAPGQERYGERRLRRTLAGDPRLAAVAEPNAPSTSPQLNVGHESAIKTSCEASPGDTATGSSAGQAADRPASIIPTTSRPVRLRMTSPFQVLGGGF